MSNQNSINLNCKSIEILGDKLVQLEMYLEEFRTTQSASSTDKFRQSPDRKYDLADS